MKVGNSLDITNLDLHYIAVSNKRPSEQSVNKINERYAVLHRDMLCNEIRYAYINIIKVLHTLRYSAEHWLKIS